MNTSDLSCPACDIVLFYPSNSLRDQLAAWAERHADCRLEVSLCKSLPGVRASLHGAAVVLLDATLDPARASDAFLQAVSRLGAHRVAVYTETMHRWLELFVRVRGALLLLGPLDSVEWEELLERMLRASRRHAFSGVVGARPEHVRPRPEEDRHLEKLQEKRSPAGRRRLNTGVKWEK